MLRERPCYLPGVRRMKTWVESYLGEPIDSSPLVMAASRSKTGRSSRMKTVAKYFFVSDQKPFDKLFREQLTIPELRDKGLSVVVSKYGYVFVQGPENTKENQPSLYCLGHKESSRLKELSFDDVRFRVEQSFRLPHQVRGYLHFKDHDGTLYEFQDPHFMALIEKGLEKNLTQKEWGIFADFFGKTIHETSGVPAIDKMDDGVSIVIVQPAVREERFRRFFIPNDVQTNLIASHIVVCGRFPNKDEYRRLRSRNKDKEPTKKTLSQER